MGCFELVAITGGVADLPPVPFEVQVGVELALCGRGRQRVGSRFLARTVGVASLFL